MAQFNLRKIAKKAVILSLSSMLFFSNIKAEAAVEEKNTEVQSKNLEDSVDSFFQGKMKQYDIPGAAVVIVDHGKVVMNKSYGFSDADEKKPFTKNTTFRIASITKTFTASALMELVEQGKVQLDEDIRTYLPDLKLNNPFSIPITVENLLTYTSGIDSSSLLELSHKEVERPCGYLLKEMNQKNLRVVTKPGTHIEYCSYGVVLEGCIIEAVSGESCADYISSHILTPLKMTHSKMSMKDNKLSRGYVSAGGKVKEYTMNGYFKLYPEGGLISSTGDMANYMEMFLNGGSFQGEKIILPETVKNMLEQRITYDNLLPGMCYGFSEFDEQGVRLVGHGGYAPDGFLSQIDLYPQYNSGTFVIVNQGSNNDVTSEFRKFYVDYKKWASDLPSIQKSSVNEKKYNVAGNYRFSDYSKTTLCKGDAFGGVGEVSITSKKNGELVMKGSNEFTGKPYEYCARKIDETHYQIKGESRCIVFLTKGKQVTGMAMTDDSWHGYYEKIHWYESGKVQVPIVVGAVLMYLGCMIGLFCGMVVRKIRKNSSISLWDKKRHGVQVWISFLNAGFLIYSMFRWGDRLRYSIPLDVKINLMMPIAASAGVAVFLVMTGKELITGQGKLRNRIWDSCFLVVSILYLALLMYWRLFGFQF